jgi:hypothetical protein
LTTSETDLAVLDDPVARELLGSRQMARLAYTWTDGTPRVVPIGFHWTGEAVVMGTPVRAPKLKALAADPRVAITIDSEQSFPFKALLLRGTAETDRLEDVSPEYEASIHRYMGPEAGEGWLAGLRGQPMVRITVRPTWAWILDFVTRFPSALSAQG